MEAGLAEALPPPHPPVPTISAAVAADVVKQLVKPDGSVISWVSCASTAADCDLLSVDEQQPAVDTGLLSAQAMAAATLGQAHPQVLSRLQQMVDEARFPGAPGKFRTNVRPLESISPRLFNPSDKWVSVDAGGFAERIENQSGDWQMFRAPANGYGNWGLHQQNGGSLLSNGALVFAAGSNVTAALRDWQGIVGFVSAARDAILKGPAAAKAGEPIVPAALSAYLTPRTEPDGLVQHLCEAARSHSARHNATTPDWWGHTQCQYYNQVQWNLVSASASVHSFVVGLLDLNVDLQPAVAKPASVSIHGVSVALGDGIVTIALPYAWPSSVARVKVSGLAVAGAVRLELSCAKKQALLKCQLGTSGKPSKSDDVSEAQQAHWRNDVANLRLVKAWDDYLAQTPLTRDRSGPVSDSPPVSLNWSVGRTDIPVGLKNGVACRFGDQIVIAGGLAYNTSAPNGTNRAWPWALVYNTEHGTWTTLEPAPPFTAGRTQGACAAEAMYIVSGASGWANSDVGVPKSAAPNPIYANVLRLTLTQAGIWQWTPLPPLPIADGGLALGVASVVDEEWLVVVGGQLITKAGEKLDKFAPGFRLRLRSDGELLSPAAMGNWSLIAPHPLARTTAAAVRIPIGGALGRSFFYFGGMATDVNRTKAYAEFNRRQICEGFMAECPLLLGPWAGHSDDHGLFMPRGAFRYDVDSDTWHTIADLPHPMHGGAQHAVAIDDRHLLLMGTSHDMSFRVGRSGYPAVTEVWTHSSPDKTAKYYNDDIVCYDRVTDTYARVGKLLYGVGTASWVLAPVSGPPGQRKLYGFGGEPMHGFNQNSETVVQVATVLNRTGGRLTTAASKSDDAQAPPPWAPRRNLFPPAAAVDVIRNLGAVADGSHDDTSVLTHAVANQPKVLLFFPTGTYLIRAQLRAQAVFPNRSRGAYHSDTFIIGESVETTTIKLADHARGFDDDSSPQAVLYTATQNPYLAGGGGNQGFHNNLRDITLDVGANQGASAIDFLGNNQGGIVRVVLLGQSSRGIGLNLTRGEQGPTLVSKLLVVGFSRGIVTAVTECSITFEHIFLRLQTHAAVENEDNTVTFRGLHVLTDLADRPVLINSVSAAKPHANAAPKMPSAATSLMTLLDSTISITRHKPGDACAIDSSLSGSLLLRNTTVNGFRCAVNNTWWRQERNGSTPPAPSLEGSFAIAEWASSPVLSLAKPEHKLSLPVRETPEEENGVSGVRATPGLWLAVNASSTKTNGEPCTGGLRCEATEPMQRAFNTGSQVVYLPQADYVLSSTVTIGSGTSHFLGMQSTILSCGVRFDDAQAPAPVLEVTDSALGPNAESNPHDSVWLEDLNFFQYTDSARFCGYRAPAGSVAVEHRTQRALVLRHIALGGVGHLGIQSASLVATLPQIGDLFIEDAYGGKMVFGGGVNVWARQLNPEPRTTLGDAHIELAGGSQLWILGLKIEQPGPVVRAVDSTLELFGGFLYPLLNWTTAFILQDAKASLSYVVESWKPWTETQYRVQVNESHGCASPDGVVECRSSAVLWTFGAHGYPHAVGPTAEPRNGYGSTVVLFRTSQDHGYGDVKPIKTDDASDDASRAATLPAPTDLRVESLAPSAAVLSVPRPRFSFVHARADSGSNGTARGLSQAAYRVTVFLVKITGHDLLWDSGRVTSPNCSQIASGVALPSFGSFFFTAKWWRSDGAVSAAASSTFETGPRTAADWGRAAFLGGTLLRGETELPVDADVWRARAYIAAPGCHSLEVNGKVPPQDYRGICPFMVPSAGQGGSLPFSPRVVYQTHNVTKLLRRGANAVGLLSGHVLTITPSILFLLRVELRNGTVLSFTSAAGPGGGWTEGPSFVADDTYTSHTDWTKCESGWSSPAFTPKDEGEWAPAVAPNSTANTPKLASQIEIDAMMMPPSTVVAELRPTSVQEVTPATSDCPASSGFVGGMRKECMGCNAADALVLSCATGVIERIDFAEWGTPSGACGAFTTGACPGNSTLVHSIVAKACLGKSSCALMPDRKLWGADPCYGKQKVLAVQASGCTPKPAEASATRAYLYAFERNFVGTVRLAPLPSATANSTIVMRLGEWLEEGVPKTRGDVQLESFTLAAGHQPPLESVFVWHGYQYVLVTCTGATTFGGSLESLIGLEIRTDMESVSSIHFGGVTEASTTERLFNRINAMSRASMVGNVAAGIPTDCPTAEKRGYLGDASFAAPGTLWNYKYESVYRSFLTVIADSQTPSGEVPTSVPCPHPHCPLQGCRGTGPSDNWTFPAAWGPAHCNDIAWTSGFPIIAELNHRFTGDTRTAERHWPSLYHYTEHLVARAGAFPGSITACDPGNDKQVLDNVVALGDWVMPTQCTTPCVINLSRTCFSSLPSTPN